MLSASTASASFSPAKIHLAEEAILQQNFDYARQQAEGVVNSAPKDSREWRKAKDVLSYLDTHDKG